TEQPEETGATEAPGGGATEAPEGEAEEEASETLRGTLRGPSRDPVVGLTITVSEDGTEVGSAATDDRGQWEVPLPGPGTYTVSYDPAGLPEGVTPAEEGAQTLEGVVVRPGASQGVIFQLGGAGQDGEDGSSG